MKTEERLKDLYNLDYFYPGEIEKHPTATHPGIFRSWEYFEIHHYSNEEFYYLSDQQKDAYQDSNTEIAETPQGIAILIS